MERTLPRRARRSSRQSRLAARRHDEQTSGTGRDAAEVHGVLPPSLACAAAGLALGVGLPISLLRQLRRQQRRSAQARGEVVGIEQRESVFERDSNFQVGPGTTHARVRFAVGARQHEFVAGYGNSWSTPRVGATVALRYDPRDPANAELDVGQSGTLMWIVIALVAASGLALFGAAFWLGA
jgi:hypothetical protein